MRKLWNNKIQIQIQYLLFNWYNWIFINLLYAVLPLWSGIILSGVNTKENSTTTDSDTSVENWFKIVKHRILNSEWTEN